MADDKPAGDSPAVEWMKQQAAAQEAKPKPAPSTEVPVSSLAYQSARPDLARREKRVADALRGNDRLTAGLPGDAAEALMAWGLALSRDIVSDTSVLGDAAAEDVLQPRVRAVRRLMMAAAEAIGQPAEADPAEWVKQAAVALGDQFRAPDEARVAALRREWAALAGRPQEQIAALRRFIDPSGGRS